MRSLARPLPLASLLIALSLAAPASAMTIWDESTDGDLSTDPNAPTPIALSPGANVIKGRVAFPNDVRDIVTFSIGTGQQLTALTLLLYEDVNSGLGGDRGFHAINLGSTSFVPSPTTAPSFLGGDHVVPSSVGTDLLPALAAAVLAGSGFQIPLGPGTYSYLIQQTGLELTAYSIDFTVVPEPSTALLVAVGLGLVAVRRKRR